MVVKQIKKKNKDFVGVCELRQLPKGMYFRISVGGEQYIFFAKRVRIGVAFELREVLGNLVGGEVGRVALLALELFRQDKFEVARSQQLTTAWRCRSENKAIIF